MSLRQLPCLLCALLASAIGAAADWPTFHRTNARINATGEQLQTPLALRWVYTAPAPPELAWSGPRSTPIEGLVMRHRVRFDDAIAVVVADGRAFFGSPVDHQVYCVEAATGKPIWSVFTEGPVRLAPTIFDGKVYAGSDDGNVYCLKADDGALVWKFRPAPRDERLLARGQMISRWPIRTGVLVDDGVAYFGAGIFPHETVYLCAVEAATGKVIWKNDAISQQDAGRNDLSPQGYLLANETLLFVPSGRALPVAVDKKTGEIVHRRNHGWRGTAGGVVGGTNALLADGQIYASGDHHFLALDEKTGNVGHAWIPGRQMTLAGDKAYIATGEAVLKVDRAAHARASIERQNLYLKLGQQPPLKPQERLAIEKQRKDLALVGIEWSVADKADGELLVAGDLVFAGGPQRITAYSASDGKLAWQADVDGEVRSLAVANGMLYASTTSGKIYAFGDAQHAPHEGKPAEHPAAIAKDASPYEEDALTKVYQAAADEILKTSQVTRGFCLVAGSERGRLAYELAKRSELEIYCVEPDAGKAAAARAALAKAGLYGHRIAVVQCPLDQIPFSNYFANLVVCDTLVATGRLPLDAAKIARHVKPLGGKLCLGTPAQAPAPLSEEALAEIVESVQSAFPKDAAQVTQEANLVTLARGALPGAGVWSHQYGNPANTCNSQDHLIKGGLGVLWYGDPGPAPMINRHEAAAAPLAAGGRMFIQGIESIMAYDTYNGLFLWERKNPGAIRTGVYNNEDTSNLAASEDALFMCVNDTCTELDAATGEVRRAFKTPESTDDVQRSWGYVAVADGKLFGTSTLRSDLARELRRRGREVANATDALFAVDLQTGERRWVYRGQNIMHMTIAIAEGRVFFINSSITPEKREEFLRADKTELEKLSGEAREKAEAELKRRDVRLAVALDANTGEELWSKPVDVTDCSHVGIGGGQMTLMVDQGHVVICGANANGHFWKQFLAGEFSKRRLLVLDARTGEKKWAKDANYRHRPIIVGPQIIAEPWAFDLATGKEVTRTHPLTGEPEQWSFSRLGHHCGAISATPNTLFFRSGFIGYYDLYEDSGTSHFAGQRPGCWINALPAGGVVAIPEASAGCVCLFSIASTVVRFKKRRAW